MAQRVRSVPRQRRASVSAGGEADIGGRHVDRQRIEKGRRGLLFDAVFAAWKPSCVLYLNSRRCGLRRARPVGVFFVRPF